MKRTTLFGIAAVVLLVDQWSKWEAIQSLSAYSRLTLVPNLFDLALVRNRGAAFGLMIPTWLLVVAAAVAIAAIVGMVARNPSPLPRVLGFGLALPLGGAFGNLIERVRLGHVTDFLDAHAGPHEFPVFNVADSCICVGVGLLVIYYWSRPADPTHVPAAGPQAAADKEIV